MAVNGFGVEHICKADRRDHTAALGLAATASGTGAVLAHKAQGDFRRLAPALRVKGVLHGVATGDADKVARHLRGGVTDAKKLAGLRYAKTGLGAAAAGLAGTAVLSAAGRRRKP